MDSAANDSPQIKH